MNDAPDKKIKIIKRSEREKLAEQERRADIQLIRILVLKRPKESREIVRELVDCVV